MLRDNVRHARSVTALGIDTGERVALCGARIENGEVSAWWKNLVNAPAGLDALPPCRACVRVINESGWKS